MVQPIRTETQINTQIRFSAYRNDSLTSTNQFCDNMNLLGSTEITNLVKHEEA